MIRIAFTSLAPFISGAERSLQVTIRHLPAAGVEPIVVGPPGAKLAPWCAENGVPFLTAPFAFRDKWHPVRWLRSVHALRGLFREHRIDLVHANQMWSYPAAGVAARHLGLPGVCHLRDESSPGALRWCCPASPAAVICISRHITRQALAAWPNKSCGPQIETLINPVELTNAPFTDGDSVPEDARLVCDGVDLPDPPAEGEDARLRIEARRAFGVPSGEVVFGFIGQVREVKGVLGLLDALAGMPPGRPWRLLVAGRDPDPGAPYERACRDRASLPDLTGRVRFLGFIEDTGLFYRALDVAIVPSREEPMGRIPLEAAAHARPSVAFAVGGLPDVILDQRTGWLVPSGDWTALGRVLARLREDPQPEVGQAARTWVEQAANPASYAQRLAALYERLLGRVSAPVATHGIA